MSTAREYEIPLDLDRLKRLVEVARDKVTNKSEFSGQESPYDNEGLIIHPPDLEDESTSRIDFLPPSTANGVVARTPQREDMTRIMLMGIRGMQDYLLLVDAGYIARPTKIRGKTNPTMATIAKRFGFVAADPMPDESMPDSKQITVEASFDDIHEHMLSPEIRRYETLLAKRAASN
ncbi:MAG TPA: hypothetical protein VMT30_05620 [Candidatus Saccharimonadia bacterium]|nr:hypothetical protein [Candidatus Saccharimonadia bacterium]